MSSVTATKRSAAAVVQEQPPPLALHDVRACYGRIEVLHGIDITVQRGQVTALLGPNGAGKTTTLGVMCGLIRPTSGCRHIGSSHVNAADADGLARIGVSHVREGRSVFPNLSVADNLVVSTASGTSLQRLQDLTYTLFPQLHDRRRQLAGTLSGGERQMLALACGLGVDPSVLLVDELSMGLAPMVVKDLYRAIAEVASAGVSVLVVEQFATIGLRYATNAYVMAHGVITYSGPSNGAARAIDAAYLGTTNGRSA